MSESEPKEINDEIIINNDQINPKNGVSLDFKNEYSAIMTIIDCLDNEPALSEKLYKSIIKKYLHSDSRLLQHYEERFAGKNTLQGPILNDKNRETVKKINELVDECNKIFIEINSDQSKSDLEKLSLFKEKLLPTINLLDGLIKGIN